MLFSMCVCVWVFALKMRMQIDGQKALQKCPANVTDKSFNQNLPA